MKQMIVVAAVFLLISAAGAVVHENGSRLPESEEGGGMMVTATTGTAAVNSNETDYTIDVNVEGQTGTVTEERLENVLTEEGRISFTGFIESPTPCHTLEHNFSGERGNYTLNIYLKEIEQICTQQVVMKEYRAEIETQQPAKLEVRHHSKTVRELETEEPETEKTEKESFLDTLFNFFSSLF